ncbi:DSS1/SEM1 family-domain-containing protein [Colletotrichum phormii]|uniref:26S proteasome complex subunit SEM1 n=1 Tax=Colletotrichum phormii TaxID=359342 RepID=A0AAI9ZIN6_9PEZI|nr:DSS1/SEM1 family-domain-containing protein [Colletotrichum phormii]KAK1625309.1 DSS1/SEM1 family-domain-containing protein [Colletotrichum phormii]
MASSDAKPQDKTASAADPKADETTQQQAAAKKPALGEDDEFEDFPVDDWPQEETEAAAGDSGSTQHLWEESWDDDDTSDDFSAQLKEELKKVEASKRR